jgi:hypothetical protein
MCDKTKQRRREKKKQNPEEKSQKKRREMCPIKPEDCHIYSTTTCLELEEEEGNEDEDK